MVTKTLRGGEKMEAALNDLAQKMGEAKTLRVGFLENATYPNGTPVAMIAAIQNFGAPAAGIPPRPFFSNMVAEKSGEWPQAIAALLPSNDFNVTKVLSLAGAAIAGQLRESITNTNDPPLAPATIKRKGFAKPLIDTSQMINSVDFEVVEGTPA